jgi:hypothetical protein
VTYAIEQDFHYTYDTPIGSPRHRLMVVPRPRHGPQYRRADGPALSPTSTLHDPPMLRPTKLTVADDRLREQGATTVDTCTS